jgi:hypothetical protein
MATKKKSKKVITKPVKKKKAAPKKAKNAIAKKPAPKKIAVQKTVPLKKPLAAKAAAKSAKPATKAPAQKNPRAMKTAKPPRVTTRGLKEIDDSVDFAPKGLGALSAGQSGDLQGLSNVAGADSESVDELVEEGNAFEAGIIKGVQDAPDADQGEVRTHEVPEDDVPREYDEE